MILINRKPVNFMKFPNGETKMDEECIKDILRYTNSAHVAFHFESDEDLIRLMFLKHYLDIILDDIPSDLHVMYMPYSRMDRSENGSAFTLKYATKFINDLNFRSVIVYEPHSDVTLALLDRVEARYPTIENLDTVLELINFDVSQGDYVFFPDAGAQKRYSKSYIGPHLVGYKQRNFTTGNLGDSQVVGYDPDHSLRKVLIVDDLCSRGGTFMAAGEGLRKLGAEEVYLFVTHCESNILNGKIFDTDVIDHVYCFDTMIEQSLDPKMTVFKL